MNTFEKLKAETMVLRKARDPLASIMQFHIAEISKLGKAENREPSEEQSVQYLKKTVQRLKEDEFSNQSEFVLLEKILPELATAEDIRVFLFNLTESGIDVSNKGIVMKSIKQEFGALVDMKMVSSMLT
jgi:uncharacterized protein YqeY